MVALQGLANFPSEQDVVLRVRIEVFDPDSPEGPDPKRSKKGCLERILESI